MTAYIKNMMMSEEKSNVGKFCPVEDQEGNDLVDSNGQVVLEKTKKVDIINCTDPTLNSIASSTTTTTLLGN